MKTLSVRLLLIFGMAVAAYAQPSIGGIANAASYDTVSFAQGSFIAIFGTNFGTTAKAGAPYPTTLGDVQEIDITPVSGGVAAARPEGRRETAQRPPAAAAGITAPALVPRRWHQSSFPRRPRAACRAHWRWIISHRLVDHRCRVVRGHIALGAAPGDRVTAAS